MGGTLVFDLDGVVYLGEESVPGAGTALRAAEEAGFHLVFATNAATRTPASVAEHITAVTGYPADSQYVVTSAVAAASMVADHEQPVFALGEEGLVQTLADAGLAVTENPTEAGAVVAGLDRGLTYQGLHRAAVAVRGGARLIATNTDATYPTPDGPAPGAGALIAAIETAAGTEAEIAGKPHPAMVTAVTGLVKATPVWVVGDRPETDLALAAAAGWGRILVLSGVTPGAAMVPPHLAPDLVLSTIAELPAVFDRLS
jgi:HAD superfamily hydrolase (TIGR01450 family)